MADLLTLYGITDEQEREAFLAYLVVMDRLCVQAESPANTTSFLKGILEES